MKFFKHNFWVIKIDLFEREQFLTMWNNHMLSDQSIYRWRNESKKWEKLEICRPLTLRLTLEIAREY